MTLTTMQALREAVKEGKDQLNLLTYDPDPMLAQYFFGRTSLALRMHVHLTIAGASKSRDPMCQLDPSLITVLNKMGGRGYFTYTCGDTLRSQRNTVKASVKVREVGTYLFSPAYNLQKARVRGRLWTISLTPVLEGKKWVLEAQVIFGHCAILPALPYDILGAAVMILSTAKDCGMPLKGISWYFHKLVVGTFTEKMFEDYHESNLITELPDEAMSIDIVRADASMRMHNGDRTLAEVPLSTKERKLLDDLHKFYKGVIGE